MTSLTFLVVPFRRTFKICKKCGTLVRSDDFESGHFMHRHFNTEPEEHGFLRVDEAPETGAEDLKVMLERIAASQPPNPLKTVYEAQL